MVGRFIQPDSIVPQPGNPQSLNRYAYTLNNPVRYADPTGHWVFEQTPEDPFYIPYYQSPTGSSMRVESDPCLGACTGPAPIDPLSQGIGEAAVGMLWEPADWAITIAHWASGDFHPLDLVGLLPLVPASVTRVARNLDEVADVARAGGQWHHIFSSKILRELADHSTLKGLFRKDDLLTQASDALSHRGYQSWHRSLDYEVVKWLRENPKATEVQFLEYLQRMYGGNELARRFPDAAAQLKWAVNGALAD